MRQVLSLLVVAGLAGPALASPLSAARPFTPGQGSFNPRLNEYMHDDGVAENTIGLTSGGAIAWATQFNALSGSNTIVGMDVAFGTPLSLNGAPVTAYLWADPNQDGNPNDAVVLASAAGVISGANATVPINSPTFVSFAFTPTTLPVGASFFLGVVMNGQAAGQFPAAIDQNSGTPLGRTWAGFVTGGGPFNPNSWTNVLDVNTIPSLAGKWLIRGHGVPAPGAVALLGLGGLVMARRRR